MAKAGFVGPLLSLGTVASVQGGAPSALSVASGVGNPPLEYSDEIGPSIFWGGMAIPATGGPGSKDRVGPGAIASVFAAFPIRTVNAILAASAGALTVAGPAVAGTPLVNLATYAAGRAPGVPVTVGGVATTGVAIDTGIDTATFATTGVLTFAAPSVAANTWRYRVGQWICLLNGGASGTALMSQITAIGVGTLTVSPPPVAAVTGQIALSNRFNYNAYGAVGAPSSISSLAAAGTARILIPEAGNTRGIGISGSASGVATIFDVVGVGAFGSIQTEVITGPVGATTAWSKKTYDMIISVTPRTSDPGHNYTVVTGDIIGLPISVMDANSIVAVTLGGTAAVAGTNFIVIPPDLTNPPSNLTGDPRGGIQVGVAGPAGSTPGTPMAAFNGTLVLSIDQRLNPLQVALATAINPGPLLGVPTV
jgi:hypothetical protein